MKTSLSTTPGADAPATAAFEPLIAITARSSAPRARSCATTPKPKTRCRKPTCRLTRRWARSAADTDLDKTSERSAERLQMRRLLEANIDALPDDYRTVFVLRAVEELSVEETAAVLGIPQATVRSRLFRARSFLREALAAKMDLACEEAFAFAGERCDRIVASVMKRMG